MSDTLAPLLARWAELAPDECEFQSLPVTSPHDWTAWLTTADDGIVFEVASDDGPTAEACVLWHVLACAARRDYGASITRCEHFGNEVATWIGVGGPLSDEDGTCPATALLKSYVASLDYMLDGSTASPSDAA